MYSCLNGTAKYTGKIIYEGEQRLKRDGDLGTLVSSVMNSNALIESILG